MSDVAAMRQEMQGIVRSAAEPWQPGDSIKAALYRATRALGLPPSRVRKFWYSQADTWGWEADRLRAWASYADARKSERLHAELKALQERQGRLSNAETQHVAAATFSVERRAQPDCRGTSPGVERRQNGDAGA